MPTIVYLIHDTYPWFWPLWVGVMGAVMGSFITCAAYRLPRGLSLRQPPSTCPACQTQLGWRALIPVISWAWQKGKCRYCSTKISARYPLIELTTIAVFLAIFYAVGLSIMLFPLWAFAVVVEIALLAYIFRPKV